MLFVSYLTNPETTENSQRYTVKDPKEFPSNHEANHSATHVEIRSQSQRDTCQHQKLIITRHVSTSEVNHSATHVNIKS
ncbi:hypothetical protein C1H46_030513 [Malus baccata]|uniref:Uncharacterized protein n=1 Tax=Malus baccata TaxID=106549 RepID=A0A540LBW5_MALBA|nr:hypothetical protein C1H46_030513 [Malus baccata]